MRSQLLSAITTAVSTLTQFAVSTELPWEQNGIPLFRKNMKKIYVDSSIVEQTTLFPVLNGAEVFQNDLITEVYLAVDAKNPPSQLDSVVTKILSCKSTTGVVNFSNESDYTVDKQEDVLTYTFEFRLNVATT
tara:strand:- start:1677 stop:2075 length:399 start_codon:yes stop_codon:yes gene_type:complete